MEQSGAERHPWNASETQMCSLETLQLHRVALVVLFLAFQLSSLILQMMTELLIHQLTLQLLDYIS